MRLCLLSITLLSCVVGCQPPAKDAAEQQLFEFSGKTMGTTYSVRVVAADQAQVEKLRESVEQRLEEVNQLMSTYIPESEISRFNTSESLDPMEISPDTAKVVSAALALAEDSRGAFDPTVGPIVDIWGFGPRGRRTRPPREEEVTETLELVGYSKISLDVSASTLSRSAEGVQLNLSAIAKGFGVDAIGEVVENSNLDSYMVEIGGEVLTRGAKPNDKPWRIGIEQPADTAIRKMQTLDLSGGALATSGDYRNYFEFEGERFSHTINPQTGRPVTHDLATVSVFANDCMTADGLATTLLVLGPKDGYNWAEQREIAALFVERLEDGFRQRATSTWLKQFPDTPVDKPIGDVAQ